MDSFESIWRRGWRDGVAAVKSFPFIIAEVGGTALIGVLSTNPWFALIWFFGLLLALFIGATATAPIRQRDDERAKIKILEMEREELTRLPNGGQRRTIPPQMKQELRALLSQHIKDVKGIWIAAFSNEECQDLAQEFVDILNDAGADKARIGQAMSGPPEPNLRDIHIHHINNNSPDLVDGMQEIFRKHGVKYELFDQNIDEKLKTPFRMVINRPS